MWLASCPSVPCHGPGADSECTGTGGHRNLQCSQGLDNTRTASSAPAWHSFCPVHLWAAERAWICLGTRQEQHSWSKSRNARPAWLCARHRGADWPAGGRIKLRLSKIDIVTLQKPCKESRKFRLHLLHVWPEIRYLCNSWLAAT